MKYGQQLESESVPEWSLHNIDYNALKQFIKANTTRDQATAITIPGHQDTSLYRFENEFYDELCRQHDRVGLFVATKASEINRRLQYLSDQINRLLLVGTTSARNTNSLKRQRRFVKYERAASQLADETRDLSRFVNAQVVAFRKILKKYRKWTGSASLSSRFRENILSDPKSFTRRDFSHLESQCDDLLATVRAATPVAHSPATLSPPETPSSRRGSSNGHPHIHSSSSSTLQALSSSAGSVIPPSRTPSVTPRRTTVLATAPVQTHYWNEYDDGSEAGDAGGAGNGGYAIYLHPDEESELPGMATLVSFFTVPLAKAKKWMAARGVAAHRAPGAGEYAPLLVPHDGYGTAQTEDDSEAGPYAESGLSPRQRQQRRRGKAVDRTGFREDDEVDEGEASTTAAAMTDEDDDDEDKDDNDDVFASDSEFPHGYQAHYASLPSINDQRAARFRETVLLRGSLGCFAASVVLLGVAGILISTGKHKLRVEVDAGVIMGVVTSLGFACAALGMIMAKNDRVPLVAQLAVWAVFSTICVLSGVELVFVMGNTAMIGAGRGAAL